MFNQRPWATTGKASKPRSTLKNVSRTRGQPGVEPMPTTTSSQQHDGADARDQASMEAAERRSLQIRPPLRGGRIAASGLPGRS